MNVAAPALVALLAAIGCAGGGGVPGEALYDPISERLVMQPYPAAMPWKQVSDRHTRDGSLTVWIPASQDLESARDLLRRRVVLRRGKFAASELASELANGIAKDCGIARSDGPVRATEDGNDVACATVTCSRGQGSTHDALVFLKVIRGHEALYVAEREFRRELDAAGLREVNDYLARNVYLCPVTGGIGRCAHLPSAFE